MQPVDQTGSKVDMRLHEKQYLSINNIQQRSASLLLYTRPHMQLLIFYDMTWKIE